MTAVEIAATANVIQALAVCVATIVGVKGINAWRRQLIGGKRVELAEEALVAANDMLDMIRSVRHPAAFGDEGSSRVPRGQETEDQARMRNTYYVPIERLRNPTAVEQEQRLSRLRTRCRVHFGDEVNQHFNKLTAAPVRIVVAAHSLIRICGERDPRTPEIAEGQAQQHEKWEDIIWDTSNENEPDEFMRRLVGAVTDLERLLRPHLDDGS